MPDNHLFAQIILQEKVIYMITFGISKNIKKMARIAGVQKDYSLLGELL